MAGVCRVHRSTPNWEQHPKQGGRILKLPNHWTRKLCLLLFSKSTVTDKSSDVRRAHLGPLILENNLLPSRRQKGFRRGEIWSCTKIARCRTGRPCWSWMRHWQGGFCRVQLEGSGAGSGAGLPRTFRTPSVTLRRSPL